MKPPQYLLKGAAIVSSVLLIGGFVSYRAGAFNGFMGGTKPTEVMSGSKSAVGLLDASTLEAPLPAPGQEPVPPIFHGSISERIVSVPRAPSAAGAPPPAATQPPTPDTTPPPVIISGTKSFIVDFSTFIVPLPPPSITPEIPPPTPKPSGRSE